MRPRFSLTRTTPTRRNLAAARVERVARPARANTIRAVPAAGIVTTKLTPRALVGLPWTVAFAEALFPAGVPPGPAPPEAPCDVDCGSGPAGAGPGGAGGCGLLSGLP